MKLRSPTAHFTLVQAKQTCPSCQHSWSDGLARIMGSLRYLAPGTWYLALAASLVPGTWYLALAASLAASSLPQEGRLLLDQQGPEELRVVRPAPLGPRDRTGRDGQRFQSVRLAAGSRNSAGRQDSRAEMPIVWPQ